MGESELSSFKKQDQDCGEWGGATERRGLRPKSGNNCNVSTFSAFSSVYSRGLALCAIFCGDLRRNLG